MIFSIQKTSRRKDLISMSTLVIAEKPSMARQIAAVLGATEKITDMFPET